MISFKNQHFFKDQIWFRVLKKNLKLNYCFFKGHLTFLRGKIIHILEQDSYRNEGLSVYEISRNGTTTKLNNKVNYKLQPKIYVGCLNKVQGLNQKESRLRGRCIKWDFSFSTVQWKKIPLKKFKIPISIDISIKTHQFVCIR